MQFCLICAMLFCKKSTELTDEIEATQDIYNKRPNTGTDYASQTETKRPVGVAPKVTLGYTSHALALKPTLGRHYQRSKTGVSPKKDVCHPNIVKKELIFNISDGFTDRFSLSLHDENTLAALIKDVSALWLKGKTPRRDQSDRSHTVSLTHKSLSDSSETISNRIQLTFIHVVAASLSFYLSFACLAQELVWKNQLWKHHFFALNICMFLFLCSENNFN